MDDNLQPCHKCKGAAIMTEKWDMKKACLIDNIACKKCGFAVRRYEHRGALKEWNDLYDRQNIDAA